jgi:hypothetical protein
MGAFFYVVAIMGCGDGGEQCRQARLLPARYATAAQCRAALPARLAENTDVPFPEISADCRPQGQQMARADAKPRG